MTTRHGLRIGAFATALAIGLAACGGGSETSSPGPSTSASMEPGAESMEPSAAESMEPSAAASGIDLGSAAGDISQLSSYQLDMSTTGGTNGDQQLTIIAQREPVQATHYIMSGLEMISIEGQGAWIKQGETWIAAPGSVDAYTQVFDALAPDTLIGAYSLGLYGNAYVDEGSEEHNGIESTHYHLDAADVTGVPGATFPDDGMVDLWIANSGGYLVGMRFSGTEPESGAAVEFRIEVSRVNDDTISFEAPI